MSSPRIPAELHTNAVTLLGHLEDRLVADVRSARADRSRSLPPTDPRSLTELVDEVAWSEPRPDLDTALVADLVTRELARGLPLVLRVAARSRPRWALSLHDERGGERHRTLDLVRATHRRLGGAPRHPSARGRRPGAS